MREQHLTGLAAVEAATVLLQRVRNAHPTAGIYQAAELQWWWRNPRSSDDVPQLFWFDDGDRPVAAVITTDWGDGSSAVYEDTTLAIIVLPDATPDWVAHVVERGLAHAAELGIDTVGLEVDRADHVMREVLSGAGFVRTGDGIVEGWLAAADRPGVSPLHDGYRLYRRTDVAHRSHHFGIRSSPRAEERLRETSLYRADLDLVIDDPHGEVAAYGLFWFDPVTATGVVEPMGTEDGHRRRGLARHVLTTGIELLAAAGAERISIGWEPDNPASGPLYRSVGFIPVLETDLFAGHTIPVG